VAEKEVYKFDALVVGSGRSGGWAAKELTKFGLKTLLFERGRPIESPKYFPYMMSQPWD
jgi:choline dehydrogenase-like flavoprotein